MCNIWDILGNNPDNVPLIIVMTIGGLIGIVGIIAGTISGVSKSKDFERSRREIAAYIAEGSMTPEEGQRILDAGVKSKKA